MEEGHGFFAKFFSQGRRDAQESFQPPQREYVGEPQDEQNCHKMSVIGFSTR